MEKIPVNLEKIIDFIQSEMAVFACSDHTYEFVNLIFSDKE